MKPLFSLWFYWAKDLVNFNWLVSFDYFDYFDFRVRSRQHCSEIVCIDWVLRPRSECICATWEASISGINMPSIVQPFRQLLLYWKTTNSIKLSHTQCIKQQRKSYRCKLIPLCYLCSSPYSPPSSRKVVFWMIIPVKRGNAAHGLRLVQHDLGDDLAKTQGFRAWFTLHLLEFRHFPSCCVSTCVPTGCWSQLHLSQLPPSSLLLAEIVHKQLSAENTIPPAATCVQRVTFRYLSEYQPGLGQACCYFLSISIWGKCIIKKMTPKGI